jgi:DNA-binding transcriptional ArsR family regulator
MRRDVFQAIADPTRRSIILLMAMGAMTPNSIAEYFHSTRQAVSKHLHVLTECGLVNKQQSGRETYYELNINKMKEINRWLDQLQKIWEGRFDQLDEVLSNLKKKKS